MSRAPGLDGSLVRLDGGVDRTADRDQNPPPRHVACVMDGNGRWAQLRGLDRSAGHAAMERAMIDTAFAAADAGVEWLTLYAFSTENWSRPDDEVQFLMELNESILVRHIDALDRRGMRLRFLGRPDDRVPRCLVDAIDEVTERTRHNRGLTLSIAFNYGGRAEIVDAFKRMLDDGVDSASLDEEGIRNYLYAPDMPDPDLVVRTSGERRISNFLLWELAYSELVFTDVLWPDFGRAHLLAAIAEYHTRKRRFGRVPTVSCHVNAETG